MEFFETKFYTYLSAFRPGYGCQSTLLRIIEDWKQALDDKNMLQLSSSTSQKLLIVYPMTCFFYVGHPISSDNGLISQKRILKSEFYYPLYVAIGVAYSC